LAKRRTRIDSFDFNHPCVDGKHLNRRSFSEKTHSEDGGATKPRSLSDPIMQRLSAFSSLSTVGSDIAGANRTRVAQIDKASAKIHIVACEGEML